MHHPGGQGRGDRMVADDQARENQDDSLPPDQSLHGLHPGVERRRDAVELGRYGIQLRVDVVVTPMALPHDKFHFLHLESSLRQKRRDNAAHQERHDLHVPLADETDHPNTGRTIATSRRISVEGTKIALYRVPPYSNLYLASRIIMPHTRPSGRSSGPPESPTPIRPSTQVVT